MSEWQLIETAPKDGKPLLCCDGHQVFIAAWPHPDSTGSPRKAWREVWHQGRICSPQPKYWQPLPEPPK